MKRKTHTPTQNTVTAESVSSKKYPLKIKVKQRFFAEKQRLREFTANTFAIKEMLENILQDVVK